MKEKLRIIRRGDKYALQIKRWYHLRWKCMIMENGSPYIFIFSEHGWWDNLTIPQNSLDEYLTWKLKRAARESDIEVIKEIEL